MISGTSTNAGYTMQIVLGSTITPQVFSADSSRTITISSSAVISGTGFLQKQGAGTLRINTAATYTGSTSIAAGTNTIGGVIAQPSTSAAYDGTTSCNVKRAMVATSTDGADILAAVADKKFRILALGVIATGGTVTNFWLEEPDGTDVPPRNRAALYEAVWGSDPAYYLAQHPWTAATERAGAHIALRTVIRQGCGELDAMLGPNLEFHAHLLSLGVPHQMITVPGVDHNPPATLQGLGEAGWDFYVAALSTPCRSAADLW